ncbi:MAG: hypothetical protein DWQ47_03410 [Acidobacteria bacterium]|nr:MAG: hypothetical protein DWQ32_06960 [Acidobacteriota bacterium]REK01451.1 MAG: hypothetical protein DWQ38_03395 [Acidobacteriota bacterium]REK14407.1 MAG: hypothetical protein DWQ43_12650 [Acidobacteriota bacterium]REK45122.1 MAG: hypothetical protein DWQ47_03410 [Acidobacteriota bacterium]
MPETGLPPAKRRGELVIPILILWSLGALVIVAYFWTDEGFSEWLGDLYLVPWALITAAVMLAPAAYLYRQGKFDPFHPTVYGVWSYLFWTFVGGSFVLTIGVTDPYFLSFIENPGFNLPLSLVYVCLGFIGMVVGFYVPIGGYASRNLEKIMPKWEWGTRDVWLPGLFLIFCGIGLNILGFIQGLLGYQRVDEIGIFDSLLVFLTTIFTLGYVLLWMGVFHLKRGTMISYAIVAFLILLIPLRMALYGSRSSLVVSVIPIGLAYWYSGRKIKWVHAAVFGALIFVAVTVGIIYGTTFRNIKGSEARINAGDYAGQVAATVEYLGKTDPGVLFGQAAQDFAERIENLSSLGVVVSNYEKLEPYEESYGIKNNIVNEFLTSFIPRFVWPDKPMVSDARAYSDLYFNFSENSFAITVFGDLLRNFGPIGIPLGMILVGVYLRIIYDLLIATPEPRLWKKAAYFPLLGLVHWEGFYSSIFPNTIRVIAVIAVALLAANLFTRKRW